MRTKLIDTASPSHVIDMKSLPRVLGRLTRLSLRYPWRAALAVIFAMGAAVLNIVTPHLLGEAVDQASNLLSHDRATAKGVLASLMSIGLLIVAASAVRGVFTGGYGYLGENIAQRVGCDLRLAFFEKLQRLSFSYHDRVHS
jgi:ATP-binding cassette subfamily B multidrug efflux pump